MSSLTLRRDGVEVFTWAPGDPHVGYAAEVKAWVEAGPWTCRRCRRPSESERELAEHEARCGRKS